MAVGKAQTASRNKQTQWKLKVGATNPFGEQIKARQPRIRRGELQEQEQRKWLQVH